MITQELLTALAHAGLDWPELCASASEIVLFGSRATGCATPASDWDLLVIGGGSRRRRLIGTVDIVPCTNVGDAWLATDIATHVSAFGQWLHGTPDWRGLVRCEQAAWAKVRLVRRGIERLTYYWERLASGRRLRHLRTLRLDAQRAIRLQRGEPVPPTRWLDEAWHSAGEERRNVVALLDRLEAPVDLSLAVERSTAGGHVAPPAPVNALARASDSVASVSAQPRASF